MAFLKNNKVKTLSLLLALVLSLFGLQTIFVSSASALCPGFCITYPLDPLSGGSTVNGQVGVFFSMQITDIGGTDPITATDWPVPIAGLTMTPSGYLSGTPTVAGTFFRSIGITDSAFHTASVSNVVFSIAAAAPAPAPSSSPVPPPLQKASISGYSPTSGPTAGGTVVTINGTFPDSVVQVHINNVAISSSLWKQSATAVTITMPAHAAGPVSIQIYNGQGPVLASQIFTYTDVAPTPSVTPSVTPTPTPTPSTAPSATPTPTPTVAPSVAPTPTPSAAPTTAPAPKLELKEIVNFANDSSQLDAAAKAAIKKIAVKINNSSASIIYLYGYTDKRGDAAYNLGLSKRRATAVSNYLRPLLTNLTLQVAWRGAMNPASTGNTEADYAKNRRVEIWAK